MFLALFYTLLLLLLLKYRNEAKHLNKVFWHWYLLRLSTCLINCFFFHFIVELQLTVIQRHILPQTQSRSTFQRSKVQVQTKAAQQTHRWKVQTSERRTTTSRNWMIWRSWLWWTSWTPVWSRPLTICVRRQLRVIQKVSVKFKTVNDLK